MKNVTISLDDETWRRARIRAAEQGTSLSAMVKAFLNEDQPPATGVHEMPMSFTHAPVEMPLPALDDDLPPGAYGRFPDGTPYYTPGGKPRQPGAMRGQFNWTEDSDSWPEGFLDAANFEDTPAARTWWMTPEQKAEYLAKQREG